MKFTLSWLREHIDFKSNINLNTIVDSLTNLGLEVESYENSAEKLKGFIISEIINVEQHPNADRLSICEVNVGKKSLKVVCGAKNVKKNLKVVFAPIGTCIPSSGLILKKKEIRGFTGEGMLCSGEELGLEEKSSGILELPTDVKVGDYFADWEDNSDITFEIGLTPNRGDCASVLGIARELAAIGLGKLKEKKKKNIKGSFKSSIDWKIDLNQENKIACSYVSGRYFKGLKNKESPEWLKKRLYSIGLRPISCLVDLTNYITFDLGRPLHVFDAKKLKGNLCIRLAKSKEKIKALDGKEYNLNDDTLIISDDKAVVSIAGVVGGEDSSCDMNTTEMFLESALFDSIYVSNSGRKLNILSDARYRFERGVDIDYVKEGLNIMTELVLNLCGGEVSQIVEAGSLNQVEQKINYNIDKVNQIGGLNLNVAKQKDILIKLGFKVYEDNKNFKVVAPSWRNDIKTEIDIVEEIIRLNGYDNIEELQLPYLQNSEAILNISELRNRIIRNRLIKNGLYESVTFSFLSENDFKNFSEEKVNCIKIDNPISEGFSIMRTSLLPNLINNFLNNINKGLKNTGLFEVGSIYLGEEEESQYSAAAGIRAGAAGNRHWSQDDRNVDIYDVKKDIFSIVKALGFSANSIHIKNSLPLWYHPVRSGSIYLGKVLLGYFGELHPHLSEKYGMRFSIFEFFTDNLLELKSRKNKKEFKKYNLMPIKRDYSFYINSNTLAAEIEKTIKDVFKQNTLVELLEVSFFDFYEDKLAKVEKKSLALEISMQPVHRTLVDVELKEISDLIINNIKEKNNAILKD